MSPFAKDVYHLMALTLRALGAGDVARIYGDPRGGFRNASSAASDETSDQSDDVADAQCGSRHLKATRH